MEDFSVFFQVFSRVSEIFNSLASESLSLLVFSATIFVILLSRSMENRKSAASGQAESQYYTYNFILRLLGKEPLIPDYPHSNDDDNPLPEKKSPQKGKRKHSKKHAAEKT